MTYVWSVGDSVTCDDVIIRFKQLAAGRHDRVN